MSLEKVFEVGLQKLQCEQDKRKGFYRMEYVWTNIVVKGDEKLLSALKEMVCSEPEQECDLNKIVPMPKDVEEPYRWRDENWGTRICLDSIVYFNDVKQLVIELNTVGEYPDKALIALCKQFPQLEFEGTFNWWGSSDKAQFIPFPQE